jgi:hypothetical protein
MEKHVNSTDIKRDNVTESREEGFRCILDLRCTNVELNVFILFIYSFIIFSLFNATLHKLRLYSVE